MKVAFKLLMTCCALALLTACGTPGAPMPPSLELPRPPQDLTATRKGNKVTLTWTPATQTTDGQNIRPKYAGDQVVCRSASDALMSSCEQIVGGVRLTAPVVPKGQKRPNVPAKASFTDTLPPQLEQQNPTGFAEYAVMAQNWRARNAGLSNQVKVPLAPTLPVPTPVEAKVTAAGVNIDWIGAAPRNSAAKANGRTLMFDYRVYRRLDTQPPVAVNGEHSNSASEGNTLFELHDRGFEWEKTYTYWVTALTTILDHGRKVAEVEGDDSAPVTVFAHDVFPPAVPQGVEAVSSGVGQKPFIDLTWTPDTEPDLAGYNVYRQEQGATEWVKLNRELVTTPAFRDENVVSGKTYAYAVSAIDVRGNESAKSGIASESVH